MLNKNVCPNCGQLYDTNLSKCPLCGTAPQVVDTADPVQRKRISEAERKQRRASRKEAEQEAKRRRKDALFMQDADEERLLEEEEARRKEEKRRLKEEKKAARRSARAAREQDALPETPEPEEPGLPQEPDFTPGPARDGSKPVPEEPGERDRRRVPRFFLILSTIVLGAALLVGGSYLLWKTDTLEIPFYDELAAKRDAQGTEAPSGPAPESTQPWAAPDTAHSGGSSIPCTGITLSQTEIVFTEVGGQTQITATLSPSNTTEDRLFESSDESVAKVSPVGIVTAVGAGKAVITVRCGSQAAECAVSCDFADDSGATTALGVDELILVKDDMTFFAAGENYVLSVTNVPAGTPVSWRSLDESICTVDAGGHVVAVGPGTTRVIATVGELTADCWVRCNFKQD